jgi:hypothetical protein
MRRLIGVTRWIHSELSAGVRNGVGNHEAATQAALLGHHVHQLAVREDVGAADVERAADGVGHAEARCQVVQHVADGDRLALGGDPVRRDHHRQPVHEVAEDLERRRAAAEDHRRPEHGERHAAAGQLLLDLAARGEVLAQARPGFAEPAQVDDAREAGVRGDCGERAGERAVVLGVGAAGRHHAVHQVEGRAAALHRRGQVGGIRHVATDDLHVRVVVPGAIGQLARGADGAADVVAGVEQSRDQAGADVAGSAGDEDAWRLSIGSLTVITGHVWQELQQRGQIHAG